MAYIMCDPENYKKSEKKRIRREKQRKKKEF